MINTASITTTPDLLLLIAELETKPGENGLWERICPAARPDRLFLPI